MLSKLTTSEEKVDKDTKGKRTMKLRYFIVLGLAGILMILISNIFSSNSNNNENIVIDDMQNEQVKQIQNAPEPSTNDINLLARAYEEDIANMLNKMQGVTEAEVMVNLDSSDVNIYERNLISGVQTTSEEDQGGGTRRVEDRTEDTQVVLVRQGDKESPVLVQTKRPEVRGVFVVAKGADQVTIKSWIIDAISSVLDVPSHRISVMPKD
ncbi:stage III sporulation protein AG [Oceanobacillus sp. CAU 1775]